MRKNRLPRELAFFCCCHVRNSQDEVCTKENYWKIGNKTHTCFTVGRKRFIDNLSIK